MHIPPIGTNQTFFQTALRDHLIENDDEPNRLRELLDAIEGEDAENIDPIRHSPIASEGWDSAMANAVLKRVISKSEMELSNCDVRDLEVLFASPELVTDFCLRDNKLFSARELKTVLKKFTQLETVDLSLSEEESFPEALLPLFSGANDAYVDSLLVILRTHASHIHSLTINYAAELNPDRLVALLKAIPDLQELSLKNCLSLRDNHLADLASCTQKLRHLDISHAEYLKGSGLMQLIRSNPQMEDLGLARCYEISSNNLLELAQHTKKLRRLDLRQLNQCTEDIVSEFFNYNPKLTHANCLRQDEGLA